ncbi:MAG: mechanosensitive ion channel protein MscS [Sphingobium sp.]|nr:mechanosensitive ion channel protein MscS [Sphingobium sp.]
MANSSTPAPTIRVPDVDLDLAKLYADSLYWVQHHWVRIGVAVAVAVIAIIGLRMLRSFAVHICNRDRPGDIGWWRIAGRTLARTGNFFIIMVGLELASGIAMPPEGVGTVIKTLFTIAAVFQGALWARELIIGAVEHHSGPARANGEALSSAINIIRIIVTFAVFAIALVVVLDNIGVNVTGLIAGLGVGGIAIGLAAQGIFADLFAALAIILDRPFRVGDVISFDQTTGTVEEIGLKSTRVRPTTGEEHIVANKQLLEKEIRNITRRAYRRNKFVLGVIYQTPPEMIARIPDMLREEVEACGQQFVQAGFAAFSASSIDIELEYDTPSPAFDPWYQARHEVGLAILRRFAAEGIEFAYPTQTTFTAGPDGTMVMPYALPSPPAT